MISNNCENCGRELICKEYRYCADCIGEINELLEDKEEDFYD